MIDDDDDDPVHVLLGETHWNSCWFAIKRVLGQLGILSTWTPAALDKAYKDEQERCRATKEDYARKIALLNTKLTHWESEISEYCRLHMTVPVNGEPYFADQKCQLMFNAITQQYNVDNKMRDRLIHDKTDLEISLRDDAMDGIREEQATRLMAINLAALKRGKRSRAVERLRKEQAKAEAKRLERETRLLNHQNVDEEVADKHQVVEEELMIKKEERRMRKAERHALKQQQGGVMDHVGLGFMRAVADEMRAQSGYATEGQAPDGGAGQDGGDTVIDINVSEPQTTAAPQQTLPV